MPLQTVLQDPHEYRPPAPGAFIFVILGRAAPEAGMNQAQASFASGHRFDLVVHRQALPRVRLLRWIALGAIGLRAFFKTGEPVSRLQIDIFDLPSAPGPQEM